MSRIILIVDHDEAIRSRVKCALSLESCAVFEAGDGIEAFEKLNGGLKPELIIAGIDRIRDEAKNLIGAIRQISAYRRTPILVMDSDSSADSQMDWKEAGATCCILKPFTTMKLLETVRLLMF